MFWIKDRYGNPINLALAHAITINGGAVVAWIRDLTGFDLFAGTPEECGRYRDDLLAKLQASHNLTAILDNFTSSLNAVLYDCTSILSQSRQSG